MKKQITNMPYEDQVKCRTIIHGASVVAGAAGAVPIPIADAIPISATQIAMIISLGKVFGLPVSRAVAEQIAGISLAVAGGRFMAANIIKAIPGVNLIVAPIVGATTAAAITEALGWLVADDFFRISAGEKPEKIPKAAGDLVKHFKKINLRKI